MTSVEDTHANVRSRIGVTIVADFVRILKAFLALFSKILCFSELIFPPLGILLSRQNL